MVTTQMYYRFKTVGVCSYNGLLCMMKNELLLYVTEWLNLTNMLKEDARHKKCYSMILFI